MRKSFLYGLVLVLGCLPVKDFAQTGFKISGTVISAADRQPLPGAAVTIKYNGKTVLGQVNGFFELYADRDSCAIRISFTGYETKEITVTKGTATNLLISLQPGSNELSNVVVSTGYQLIPKERATGSFERLDSTVISRGTSGNVLERLDGMASSVLFDKRTGSIVPHIQVRGLSTITSSITSPLIIVDNFPFNGDMRDINPNDVESISILKDAAATSIWGARAGNGVIVITTKKAAYNHPLQVHFNSSVTLTDKPDLFALQRMSSADFIGVEETLFDKGYYDWQLEDTYSYPLISPVVELLNKERNGELTASEVQAQMDAYKTKDFRYDVLKYLYRRGVHQQYSIGIEGGSATANYLLSVGYDKDLQSLIGNSYERFTVHSDNTFRPLKKLEVHTSVFYTETKTKSNNPGGYGLIPGGFIATYYPYASLTNEAGQPAALPKDYRKAFLDTAGGGGLLDWSYRPLDELKYADNQDASRRLLLHASARYSFTGTLNAEVQYQYEVDNSTSKDYHSEATWYTRNMINMYSRTDDGSVTRAIPLGGIMDEGSATAQSHNLRGQLNYASHWNKNEVNVIAGAELREDHTTNNSFRAYGYSDNNLTAANIDYLNAYPTFNDLLGDYYIPSNLGFGDQLNRFVSVYGNASYSFDNRYLISGSARKDASNLFGVATNQKGVPLWSAGLGWNVSNESFYQFAALPFLKLRGSYGYSGNVNNSLSALTTLRYLGSSYLTNLPYSSVRNPPNPSLRWEKTGMINVGMDFATAKNRLSGSIEYYDKRSEDLFGLVPVDMTLSGATFLELNSASLHTKGWDISLNSKNLNGKIKWTSRLLFSTSHNKVTKYDYPSAPHFYVGDGSIISPIEGQPAYNIVSFKFDGLDHETGDPIGYFEGKQSKDYNSIAYEATENDIVFNGSAIPTVFGSLRNDFSAGPFSLSFNILYKLGYYFRRSTINYTALYVQWMGHSDFEQRWQKPGDENFTNIPSMPYPLNGAREYFYSYSNATVEKGDHIRLQDIRLNYTLTKQHTRFLPFQNLQFYFYVNNVAILWRANKKSIDPDIPSGTPLPRSYAFGIKADF